MHHALKAGDLAVVSALFDSDQGLVGFEKSFELVANRQEAQTLVREAFIRRQEHIVQPALLGAAMGQGSVDELKMKLEIATDIFDISSISRGEGSDPPPSPIFLAVENGSIEVVKFFIVVMFIGIFF